MNFETFVVLIWRFSRTKNIIKKNIILDISPLKTQALVQPI